MLQRVFFIVLAAAMAGAQTQGSPAQQPPGAATGLTTPKQQATPAPPAPAAEIASTAPVITIDGICKPGPERRAAAGAKTAPASAAPCKTILTKADFEKLLSAVTAPNQNIPPAQRRNLAQAYVELLAFAQAGEKAGVDKDPTFAESMRIARLQALSKFYRQSLEEKYRTPAASDVETYYNQNIQKYEEIKLSRIFVPSKNVAAANKDELEKKAADVAGEIHDRAAKGEDFEKLQKETYTALGLTIAPPGTSLPPRRRGMAATKDDQELFGLNAGDVSKVEQEPAGYTIYKVESKETLPLDKVKDEISRELFRQNMDTQIKAVNAPVHADLNDQYFGPPNAPRPIPGAGQPRVVRPAPNAASQPGSPTPGSQTPGSQSPAPPK